MTDDTGNARATSQKAMTEVEGHRTIPLPVDQIVHRKPRHSIRDARVAELAERFELLGLATPILVTLQTRDDGTQEYLLVAGLPHLETQKRRGVSIIQCTVLEAGQALHIELAEIDENLTRNDPSPAEHALLTGRRREIILELAAQDGTVLQSETASNQRKRRAGQETGPDIASLTDQANKTGENKSKVQRSRKRYETLGSSILAKVVNSSLDTGTQLDALTQVPEAVRDDLAERAAAGERVSARKEPRKAKREAKEEPKEQSQAKNLRQAFEAFFDWFDSYSEPLEENDLVSQTSDYWSILYNAVKSREEPDALEQASEPPRKRRLLDRLRGRKGD
jgi:hypothetical protein